MAGSRIFQITSPIRVCNPPTSVRLNGVVYITITRSRRTEKSLGSNRACFAWCSCLPPTRISAVRARALRAALR